MKAIPIRHFNPAQKEPGLAGSFGIKNLQELLAEGDMVQELHRHDFFYLLILKKAAGAHEIDFSAYKVSDNTIFLMRPGQVHQLTLKAGSIGWLVQFKSDFFFEQDKLAQQFLRKIGSKNFHQLEPQQFEELESTLTAILSEYTNRKDGYQEVIKLNLHIFFVKLGRNNASAYELIDLRYQQEQLDRFLTLLEENISQYKRVAQYTELLNLSAYQLNAITKQLLNKSALTIIQEQILLESKRQLLATSNQINQIAYMLGYEDVSYFIRFFKKHTGRSPDAFRQNFK